MALLDRLRRLVAPTPVPRPAARGSATTWGPDEDLRRRLLADPNDAAAFGALAESVRRRAGDEPTSNPLAAPSEEPSHAADLAVWALAEDLAGNPRAWFPLVELARLSVDDDREGALRRLTTAAERDPSGRALAEGMAVLREAGLPVEALGLGVGHWRAREHDPGVGRQLVLAALEAERPAEARHHLESIDLHPDHAAVEALRVELEPVVARAERRAER
jgi:hypothetical protein